MPLNSEVSLARTIYHNQTMDRMIKRSQDGVDKAQVKGAQGIQIIQSPITQVENLIMQEGIAQRSYTSDGGEDLVQPQSEIIH